MDPVNVSNRNAPLIPEPVGSPPITKPRLKDKAWGWVAEYRKLISLLLFGGGFVLFVVLIFLNVKSAPEAPGNYYVKTLGGYVFSNTPGYDVVLGTSYKPVTEEVVTDYEVSKNELTDEVKNIPPTPPFFNPGTGEPLAWYNASGDGVKLFALPGFDPCTGEPLRPINREIAQAFCKSATAMVSAATFECSGVTGLKVSWPFGMMGGMVVNNASGTVNIYNK